MRGAGIRSLFFGVAPSEPLRDLWTYSMSCVSPKTLIQWFIAIKKLIYLGLSGCPSWDWATCFSCPSSDLLCWLWLTRQWKEQNDFYFPSLFQFSEFCFFSNWTKSWFMVLCKFQVQNYFYSSPPLHAASRAVLKAHLNAHLGESGSSSSTWACYESITSRTLVLFWNRPAYLHKGLLL